MRFSVALVVSGGELEQTLNLGKLSSAPKRMLVNYYYDMGGAGERGFWREGVTL